MVPVVALTLGAITVGQRVLGLPDAAFHLVQGRIVLQRGLPDRELLAFTSDDGTWVLQSWLVDAAWALVEHVGGLPLLHTVLVATVTATYLAVGSAVWRRSPGWASPVLLLLTLVAATSHLTLRPSLLSVVFLLLTWALARGWGRSWWALPLFALWANVHGAFLVGLGLIGAVLAGEALGPAVGAPRRPDQARRAGIVLVAAAAGALINPYGAGLWSHLFELAGAAPGLITEWAPPDLRTAPAWSYLAILGLVVTGMARATHVRMADVAIVLFALAAALAAGRNTTASAVLTAVAGGPYVTDLLRHSRPATPPPSGEISTQRWARPAIVALLAALAAALPLTLGRSIDQHVHPDVPIALVDRLPSGSKVFTNSVVGPYVSLLRWPDVLMAFDGRVDAYPLDRFERMREAWLGMPGWEATLDEIGATHVLVTPDDPLGDALDGAADWRVVGADQAGATLFTRR